MKKVLLAVLCTGLIFACCNRKKAEPQPVVATDTTVAEVIQEPTEPEVVEAPVEEPAQPAAPAKKNTTTAKKNTSSTGMTASKKTDAAPTVEEHAKNAANRVANKAIDKAEEDATTTIVNSGKKKR